MLRNNNDLNFENENIDSLLKAIENLNDNNNQKPQLKAQQQGSTKDSEDYGLPGMTVEKIKTQPKSEK